MSQGCLGLAGVELSTNDARRCCTGTGWDIYCGIISISENWTMPALAGAMEG